MFAGETWGGGADHAGDEFTAGDLLRTACQCQLVQLLGHIVMRVIAVRRILKPMARDTQRLGKRVQFRKVVVADHVAPTPTAKPVNRLVHENHIHILTPRATVGRIPHMKSTRTDDVLFARIPTSTTMAAGLIVVTALAMPSIAPADELIPLAIPSEAQHQPDIVEPTQNQPTMRFDILGENDGGVLKYIDPTDRHYTNGIKFSLAWQPDWAQNIADAIPFADHFENMQTAFGLVLGQDMYTPEIITTITPDPTDQPYAGWLYTGAYVQRANGDRNLFDHLEINLGMLGPSSGAKGAQQAIHDLIGDQEDPSGWGSQLGDEFGFNLIYQRKWRYPLIPGTHPAASTTNDMNDINNVMGQSSWGADFIPQVGFILGTMQRQANLGFTARWGWNLPDDFGPARLRDLGDATASTTPNSRNLSAYLFAQINGTAVEHNTFIEGNNYKSSPGHDAKPLVGDATVGFSVAWKYFQLTYYQTFMTDTFDGQRGSDSYAGMLLTTSWNY